MRQIEMMSTKCPLGILGKANFMPENLSGSHLVICLFSTWFWFFSLHFWFEKDVHISCFAFSLVIFFLSYHFLSILSTLFFYLLQLWFCLSLYLPHPKTYNTFWFCPFSGLIYFLKLAYGTVILIQLLVCVSGWQLLATNYWTCQFTAAYIPS